MVRSHECRGEVRCPPLRAGVTPSSAAKLSKLAAPVAIPSLLGQGHCRAANRAHNAPHRSLGRRRSTVRPGLCPHSQQDDSHNEHYAAENHCPEANIAVWVASETDGQCKGRAFTCKVRRRRLAQDKDDET